MMEKSETASWLNKSPHKYPRIPYIGMAKNTPQIRMIRPDILMNNVKLVFPRPFIMLKRALFVYKNGQIHARVSICFPAVLPVSYTHLQASF